MHFQWKKRQDLFIFVDTFVVWTSLQQWFYSSLFSTSELIHCSVVLGMSHIFIIQHKHPIKAGAAVERWVWICSSSSWCLNLTFLIIQFAFVFTSRYRILYHTSVLFVWAEWNNTIRTCCIQSSDCNASRNAVKIFCSQTGGNVGTGSQKAPKVELGLNWCCIGERQVLKSVNILLFAVFIVHLQ